MANKHITVGINSYEQVKTFKYSGFLSKNLNSVREEVKCGLKAGDSGYYCVQTLLYSKLLSKNLKIKIYKTIILPFLLYSCETWSLTLMDERRLRVFGNRILRRIFGSKKDENGESRRLHK